MKIEIPELCVTALIGASGSGKSTFAKKHFRETEILGSDYFRALVSDDEADQSATEAAFESLYFVANKRLDNGKLTVIDATSVQQFARKKIIDIARSQDLLAAAIVFDIDEEICIERNRLRTGRSVPPHVVRNHVRDLKKSVRRLEKEGFRYVYVLKNQEEIDAVEIVRAKLWNDRRDESGPFDIIGDVHGCYRELCALLEKLGYAVDRAQYRAAPPPGRRAVFLGDLCDRGPRNVSVLRLVMNMCETGAGICVPGNHDVKLLRALRNRAGLHSRAGLRNGAGLRDSGVRLTHGLDLTVSEIEKEPPEFIAEAERFLDGLVSHYVFDHGRLVVAHAGLSEKLQGRSSGRVRNFCLYGDTTGETDEFGLPVRLDWAEGYRGKALVVYGHIPSAEAREENNTVCIDTGCVFGGKLSAYRYPEKEIVQVPAEKEYCAPVKPLGAGTGGASINPDMPPDISDITGRRRIQTRLYHGIPVSEEAAAATLEIMSRFSADPRWLIYLPPAMAPCGTSGIDPFLEHPEEAFDYFRKHGVTQIVCEEKHMGSRAVIVLCRSREAAQNRFGVQDAAGIIYTRTGRHFFDGAERDHETAILARLRAALDASGFWERFATDWVCLDAELMPWSAKARALILEQYAPAGLAGRQGLARAVTALEQAARLHGAEKIPGNSGAAEKRSIKIDSNTPVDMDIDAVLDRFTVRKACIDLYTDAYRRYCWNVNSVDDYRVAPFHILATEDKVWNSENHLRHLAVIKEYVTGSDPVFAATNHIAVDLDDPAALEAGIAWWLSLTGSGGEGMVVKPLDFLARHENRLIQPAVKCRGREYLRIIYGPDYTTPAHLERLRKRSLRKKQELALAEFSLGMESLERFVNREPFHRVHECVFGVLALENETVDPRL